MDKSNSFSNVVYEYDNFCDFAKRNKNIIYRYWIYRRGYTPYEEHNKFMDESLFEETVCKCALIRCVVPLYDGDLLIGFLDADSVEPNAKQNMEFCKLSEIRFEWYEGDQEEYGIEDYQ